MNNPAIAPSTGPVGTRRARTMARSLVSWGASEVEVVEAFGRYGTEATIVRFRNRCGMPRTIANEAEFIEAREALA